MVRRALRVRRRPARTQDLWRYAVPAQAPTLTVDSVKSVIDGWADAASDQAAAWYAKK
jgi:hypothetical protein